MMTRRWPGASPVAGARIERLLAGDWAARPIDHQPGFAALAANDGSSGLQNFDRSGGTRPKWRRHALWRRRRVSDIFAARGQRQRCDRALGDPEETSAILISWARRRRSGRDRGAGRRPRRLGCTGRQQSHRSGRNTRHEIDRNHQPKSPTATASRAVHRPAARAAPRGFVAGRQRLADRPLAQRESAGQGREGARVTRRDAVPLADTCIGILYGMKKTTVYVSPEVKRALGRLASARGTSEAELIREALRKIVADAPAPRPRLPLIESGSALSPFKPDPRRHEGGRGSSLLSVVDGSAWPRAAKVLRDW